MSNVFNWKDAIDKFLSFSIDKSRFHFDIWRCTSALLAVRDHLDRSVWGEYQEINEQLDEAWNLIIARRTDPSVIKQEYTTTPLVFQLVKGIVGRGPVKFSSVSIWECIVLLQCGWYKDFNDRRNEIEAIRDRVSANGAYRLEFDFARAVLTELATKAMNTWDMTPLAGITRKTQVFRMEEEVLSVYFARVEECRESEEDIVNTLGFVLEDIGFLCILKPIVQPTIESRVLRYICQFQPSITVNELALFETTAQRLIKELTGAHVLKSLSAFIHDTLFKRTDARLFDYDIHDEGGMELLCIMLNFVKRTFGDICIVPPVVFSDVRKWEAKGATNLWVNTVRIPDILKEGYALKDMESKQKGVQDVIRYAKKFPDRRFIFLFMAQWYTDQPGGIDSATHATIFLYDRHPNVNVIYCIDPVNGFDSVDEMLANLEDLEACRRLAKNHVDTLLAPAFKEAFGLEEAPKFADFSIPLYDVELVFDHEGGRPKYSSTGYCLPLSFYLACGIMKGLERYGTILSLPHFIRHFVSRQEYKFEPFIYGEYDELLKTYNPYSDSHMRDETISKALLDLDNEAREVNDIRGSMKQRLEKDIRITWVQASRAWFYFMAFTREMIVVFRDKLYVEYRQNGVLTPWGEADRVDILHHTFGGLSTNDEVNRKENGKTTGMYGWVFHVKRDKWQSQQKKDFFKVFKREFK
jgi:hypothetical protein